MYFKTQGVILSRKNLGESDRILTVFTRDFGKLVLLAKGVRRPKSRKSGHVEIANWCKLFIARGKNFDLLTEVETKKAFGIADFNIAKVNKIYHLLELVESLTEVKQKNSDVFILLVNFLNRIAGYDNFSLLSMVFKIKLLSILGFFSASNIKDSQVKDVFETCIYEDFDIIKENFNYSETFYLKLLSFLDSMIENLTQKKLKTSKFL